MTAQPARGGNPVAARAGVEQRNRIIELVATNVDHGGDGMSRAELATALGISRPGLHRHLVRLFEDGLIEQIGPRVLPSNTGHIHICRTCGQTQR